MTEPRTHCLNLRCQRTFKQEHEGETVVCGKCWKLLPAAVRQRGRLIERMAAKGTAHRRRGRKFGRPEIGAPQSYTMGSKFDRLWERHWTRIRIFFHAPDKPEGLETFLEEIGL